MVLALGLRSVALSCQRVTSGISFICATNGFTLLNYLDDLIGIESQDNAWQAFDYLGILLMDIGLREHIPRRVCQTPG